MKGIIGVDCSTKNITAVILSPDGEIMAMIFIGSELKDMDERLVELGTGFQEKLSSNVVCGEDFAAFVENAIYLNNSKVTIGIAQVVGVVKFLLESRGIKCFGVDNRSWKKFVLANGRADKEKIMKFAKVKWGASITSQDEADASCLSLFGVMRVVGSVR